MGFTGFYLVLVGFTGLYLVLKGFSGFYWVLLGFTGFYWVYLVLPGILGILGLARFYRERNKKWACPWRLNCARVSHTSSVSGLGVGVGWGGQLIGGGLVELIDRDLAPIKALSGSDRCRSARERPSGRRIMSDGVLSISILPIRRMKKIDRVFLCTPSKRQHRNNPLPPPSYLTFNPTSTH